MKCTQSRLTWLISPAVGLLPSGAIGDEPSVDREIRAGDADLATSDARTASRPPLVAEWGGTKSTRPKLPPAADAYRGVDGSTVVLRGPLVLAPPAEAGRKRLNVGPQFAGWKVHPKSTWDDALDLSPGRVGDPLRFREVWPAPATPAFWAEGTKVVAEVRGPRPGGWGTERRAAPPPRGPVAMAAPLETLKIAPYGCTDLRLTEFPTLRD